MPSGIAATYKAQYQKLKQRYSTLKLSCLKFLLVDNGGRLGVEKERKDLEDVTLQNPRFSSKI